MSVRYVSELLRHMRADGALAHHRIPALQSNQYLAMPFHKIRRHARVELPLWEPDQEGDPDCMPASQQMAVLGCLHQGGMKFNIELYCAYRVIRGNGVGHSA